MAAPAPTAFARRLHVTVGAVHSAAFHHGQHGEAVKAVATTDGKLDLLSSVETQVAVDLHAQLPDRNRGHALPQGMSLFVFINQLNEIASIFYIRASFTQASLN